MDYIMNIFGKSNQQSSQSQTTINKNMPNMANTISVITNLKEQVDLLEKRNNFITKQKDNIFKGARDSFLEKSRAKNKGFKGAEAPSAEALANDLEDEGNYPVDSATEKHNEDTRKMTIEVIDKVYAEYLEKNNNIYRYPGTGRCYEHGNGYFCWNRSKWTDSGKIYTSEIIF